MPEQVLNECFRRIIAATGLHRDGEILDAGCGAGQLSMPLVRRGFSVIGIDVSEAMLDIVRAKVHPEDEGQLCCRRRAVDVVRKRPIRGDYRLKALSTRRQLGISGR